MIIKCTSVRCIVVELILLAEEDVTFFLAMPQDGLSFLPILVTSQLNRHAPYNSQESASQNCRLPSVHSLGDCISMKWLEMPHATMKWREAQREAPVASEPRLGPGFRADFLERPASAVTNSWHIETLRSRGHLSQYSNETEIIR